MISSPHPRPPRLLNLCPTADAVGGVARIAVYTAALLQRRGWFVRTVFPAGSDREILDRWSREYDVELEIDSGLLTEYERYAPRHLLALRSLARDAFDVAVVHLGTQSIPPRLFAGLRSAGISTCVPYCHAAYPWDGWGDRQRSARRNTRLASRMARAVVACSGPVAHELVDAGVDPDKVSVITTGIRLETRFDDRATARRALDLPEDAVVIGSILRFAPEKAPHVLVKAIAELPEAPFLAMQGEGALKSEIEELASELLGDRAKFFDKSSDVSALYAACDVFALTSLNEGFPLVLQEAAAHSRPVVATDVGGVKQLVVEDVTGYVVPPGDHRPVTAALVRMLADADRRVQMGEAARARAESEFSEEITIDRLDALLRSLLRDGDGSSRRP